MDSSTTRTTYRRRWTEAVHLFVLFAALYGLMGRGTFFTSDEGGIINTALAILGRGSFAIAPGENIHRGPDGRFYACREFLPTLLCLPTAFAGSLFESALRPPPPPVAPLGGRLDGTNWLFFLTITFLGPALAAGTLVVLYQTVLDVGGSRTAALWLSVVAGLSTPIVFYARTIFPQILETLLLATAFYSAIHWRSGGTSRSALTMGVACGLGLMTRAAFAPVVVWFLGFLLLTGSTSWRRRLGCMLLFAVPVVVGGAVTGWYNWVRWGSPFDSGYHNPNEAFTTPLMTGVVGLLFSPGKGLFVYAS